MVWPNTTGFNAVARAILRGLVGLSAVFLVVTAVQMTPDIPSNDHLGPAAIIGADVAQGAVAALPDVAVQHSRLCDTAQVCDASQVFSTPVLVRGLKLQDALFPWVQLIAKPLSAIAPLPHPPKPRRIV